MDIFISYRREGGGDFCGRLFDRLTAEHYTAFYDKESLTLGKFNEQIYKKIAACNNFVLILPRGGLDRCVNDDDWVRKEIRKAIELNKNVIPIFLKGFEYPEKIPDDIATVKDYQGIVYDSSISRFDDMFNVLTTYLVDGQGNSLLASRKQGVSNTYYESNGITEREKNRIKSDREACRAVEDEIFAKLLSDKKQFVIFNPAVYEITSTMDKYEGYDYSTVLGFLCNQAEADEANRLYGERGCRFYPGDMENEDFESKMDKIMAENHVSGFDFVDLTLILKDCKNPSKKLQAVVERLNDDAIIYVRELDDGMVVCNPDPSGLFKKMLTVTKQDKYAGRRDFGRKVYTMLKNLDADEVCAVDRIVTTSGMKMKKRKILFDTYFSYVMPEFEDLVKEEPDNEQYTDNLNWLRENYDRLEQAFMNRDFFFVSGFMFFYAKFDKVDD